MVQSILPDRPHYFLTDGGIETTMIFDHGFDLPYFAAFTLLETDAGRAALVAYFERYIGIAKATGWGFILESATWRASSDWGSLLNYTKADLAEANKQAICMLQELNAHHQTASSPMLVSGCIGPRGDGYDAGKLMTPGEAQSYHSEQINVFAQAGVDMVTAITMTNTAEAIGLCRAAQAVDVPCVVSFTVETDGCLPTGQPLKDAIVEVDSATNSAPAYFMINCAHPDHFRGQLNPEEAWISRLWGIRANASRKSHAELDESESLDRGDSQDLAQRYAELCGSLPDLRVLGGCCGTDHQHMEDITRAITGPQPVSH